MANEPLVGIVRFAFCRIFWRQTRRDCGVEHTAARQARSHSAPPHRNPGPYRQGPLNPQRSWPCRASSPASRMSRGPFGIFADKHEASAGLESPVGRSRDRRGAARPCRKGRIHGRSAQNFDLHRDLKIALLPKDAADEKNAILEIRAGTGGSQERRFFAGDLFRMYQRYAELKGWRVEILAASEGTSGGYKEIIAEIAGLQCLRAFENSDPARIGCNACRKPRHRGAFIPRRQPSRSCPKRRKSTSRSTKRT